MYPKQTRINSSLVDTKNISDDPDERIKTRAFICQHPCKHFQILGYEASKE